MTDEKPHTTAMKPIPGLRGSEQHHPLKNQPGEKGDPDHTDPEGANKVDAEIKKAVSNADDDTAIESAMKKAAS